MPSPALLQIWGQEVCLTMVNDMFSIQQVSEQRPAMQPIDKSTHGTPHCSQASMRALKPGLCSASVRVDACGDASIASRLTPGDCCRRHCALAPPGDAPLRPGTRSRPSVAGVRGVALLGLRLGLGRLAPAARAAPREGVSAGAWSWRGVHDGGAFAAAAGDACSNLRLDAFKYAEQHYCHNPIRHGTAANQYIMCAACRAASALGLQANKRDHSCFNTLMQQPQQQSDAPMHQRCSA